DRAETALPAGRLMLQQVPPAGTVLQQLAAARHLDPLGRASMRLQFGHKRSPSSILLSGRMLLRLLVRRSQDHDRLLPFYLRRQLPRAQPPVAFRELVPLLA